MAPSVGERRLNVEALRQRLRQGRGGPAPEPPAAPAAPFPHALAQLGGEERDGCYVVAHDYEGSHEHAGVALHALWHLEGRALGTLGRDRALADFDFRRTLFLDTETNGLAGGAGTYAFLVGVAYWEGERFCVRQLFMRHPGEERALLAQLEPLLERCSSFVTFNGKSFDLPVLETRFVLARQPRRLRARPHLDLLHPARRLWKLRLDSCSLGSLEQKILGVTRSESDVPGHLIPHLYHGFLRDGNPTPLRGIFYHNHQDLLALAALAVHMARLCADPTGHAPRHGQDWFSLGRLFEEAGDGAQAEQCLRQALAAPLPLTLRREALRRLALLFKRQGRWDEACVLWRSLVGQGELYPYVELAKFHEHRSGDLPAAERATCAALEAARRGDFLLPATERDALHHRLERLHRKQQPGSPPPSAAGATP